MKGFLIWQKLKKAFTSLPDIFLGICRGVLQSLVTRYATSTRNSFPSGQIALIYIECCDRNRRLRQTEILRNISNFLF